jgi:putative spermidine/putrescine transport system permease protein
MNRGSALLIWPLPLFLLIAYVAPFVGVAAWSVTLPEPGVQHYDRLLTDGALHQILIRTLRICALTTLFAVGIGYLIAYHWVYGSERQRRFVEVGVLIPFWISVLIRAFAWLAVLRTDGVLNSSLMWLGVVGQPLALVRNELGVLIGMIHFMIPYAIFPLSSVMRQIDPSLLRASRGLGAGRVRAFLTIFLPLSAPGILGSAVIVFVFSLGFFVTPAILGGGRTVMIAEFIYLQMFQTANWGEGATLAVILVVAVFVLLGVLVKLTRVERLMR